MAVQGVTSGSSALYSTGSSGQVDNPKSSLNKNDFLKMLVTKLQYQDPTNPVTDESFVADMAQFSSLEQMQNLNTSFTNQSTSMQDLNKNLVALIMMQNTTQAAGLIGKNVTIATTVTASDGTTTAGPDVTGAVTVVKFIDGQPKIVVGGITYDIANVKEIKA